MIVDATHKPWIVTAVAMTVAGTAFYIPYAITATSGPSGGTVPGLIYGIAGTAMMAFAGLLSARKKAPTLRIGRIQLWMKGHVWLGLLSFPMILFHSGFSLGGSLTGVLMLLFVIITLSGILGVVLQQFIPRLMSEEVPAEVVFEQADQFLEYLRQTARQRVESLKPKAGAEDKAGYEIVKEFYTKEVEPFLKAGVDEELLKEEGAGKHRGLVRFRWLLRRWFHRTPKYRGLMSRSERARVLFDHVGVLVPPASHAVVDDLRKFVQQRRDLLTQVRLHHILHGWLLVHVPLSAALLVLTIIHAVMALRYN